jgi:pyrroline-5-carboxylate reductase
VRVALIGAGAMGEAIVTSLIRAGVSKADELSLFDVSRTRLDYIEQRYGARAATSADQAAQDAAHIVLAVKPQDFEKVAKSLAGLDPGVNVISIMAGVTIRSLVEDLRHQAVVRSIPNTPAQIGEGMTVWTATSAVGEQARTETSAIFASLGRQVFVPDERYIDMATAISGSGPGFVFLIIEAFIDAAVHIGFSRDMATEMVLQTVAGSARFAQETGKHPAELKNMVSSPGGTTIEGLQALEARGLRAALTEAVIATYNKSKALGGAPNSK